MFEWSRVPLLYLQGFFSGGVMTISVQICEISTSMSNYSWFFIIFITYLRIWMQILGDFKHHFFLTNTALSEISWLRIRSIGEGPPAAYRTEPLRGAVLCCVALHCAMLCCVMFAMLWHVMLLYSCYILLCFVMLCYGVLYCVMLLCFCGYIVMFMLCSCNNPMK